MHLSCILVAYKFIKPQPQPQAQPQPQTQPQPQLNLSLAQLQPQLVLTIAVLDSEKSTLLKWSFFPIEIFQKLINLHFSEILFANYHYSIPLGFC